VKAEGEHSDRNVKKMIKEFVFQLKVLLHFYYYNK